MTYYLPALLITAALLFDEPHKGFPAMFPETRQCEEQVPELQVVMRMFYRRSGDMVSDKLLLRQSNDTIHFIKRTYSDRFRIYQIDFNNKYYKVRKAVITGYHNSKKLYSTDALLRTATASTAEFQDTGVNMKENRLKIEIVFEVIPTQQERKWTVNVLLDKEWM